MSAKHTDRGDLEHELPGIHPAFPIEPASAMFTEYNGLTKREYIATALLTGLLTQRRVKAKTFSALVGEAIEHTDELLQQLGDAPTRDI